MPRAKRGFKKRRRHKKVFERASGFVLGLGNKFKRTSEAVDRAHGYAFRDRRAKKGEFRRLWIQRINAAARLNKMSYSQLMFGLKKAGIGLDRKMLAELAVSDAGAFKQLAEAARTAVAA
jgi:large subunit ribosomal protein L20